MKRRWPSDLEDLEDFRRLIDFRGEEEASRFLMNLLSHRRAPVVNPGIVDEAVAPPPPRPEPAPPPEAQPPAEETMIVVPAEQAAAMVAASESGVPLCET